MIPSVSIEHIIRSALSMIEPTTATAADVRDQCRYCSFAPWTRFNKMFPKDNLAHPHRGKIIKQGDKIVRMSKSVICFETYHRECAVKILKQINDRLNKKIKVLG